MEFIMDNIVWFIVGLVVLLMTLIGYFAEKTDFGRKSNDSKKKDNNDNDISSNNSIPSVVDTPVLPTNNGTVENNDVLYNNDNNSAYSVDNSINGFNLNEDLSVPISDNSAVNSVEEVDPALFAPITSSEPVAATPVVENIDLNQVNMPVANEIELNQIPSEQSIESPVQEEIKTEENISAENTTVDNTPLENSNETISPVVNPVEEEKPTEIVFDSLPDNKMEVPVANEVPVSIEPVLPAENEIDSSNNDNSPVVINDDNVKTVEELEKTVDLSNLTTSVNTPETISQVQPTVVEPALEPVIAGESNPTGETITDDDIWKF